MTFQYDNRTNQLQIVDSGANASATFQSKGTGALNFAPGSSGLNLSNGGTVTAITRTSSGTNYTSSPSIAISAPTTAGGVQATATCTINLGSFAVVAGGTGYTVGDTLTLSGGTYTSQAQAQVTTVSAGVITSVTPLTNGSYTVAPSNPASVTGGTGTGATLSFTGGVTSNGFTITNAGSGYVEQPTVSFSGGGGSGAAAYASIGSNPVIKGLAGGSSANGLTFANASGNVLSLVDGLVATPATLYIRNSGNSQIYPSSGSLVISGGTGTNGISFYSNATNTLQMVVGAVASAVNYVQVTGAATGSNPIISSTGSDTNVSQMYLTKGAGEHRFATNTSSNIQVRVIHASSSTVNYLQLAGSAAGSAPAMSVAGTDTNIGLNLTAKGAGDINFFANSNDIGFKVSPNGTTGNSWVAYGSSISPVLEASGSATNVNGIFRTKGSGIMVFRTNIVDEQLRVAHTASAVNYVAVTGNATGFQPTISSQGSDANIGLRLLFKGNGGGTPGGGIILGNAAAWPGLAVQTVNNPNYFNIEAKAAGSAPVLSTQGSDTNIDLALTPKGTGYVQFGTYTGTALTIAGYIEIKDAGGTIRRLAVVA